ncbi:MAG TPA: hypothetical protein VM029_08710 [Opitutaceae bacterium]|nr:hypothetical protein [Opitutaceae bacterium]
MNSKQLKSAVMVAAGALALAMTGCGRQTRGNADAEANRAKTPAEGGATSTKGDAGSAKNFGDLEAKKATDEASPSGQTTSTTGTTGGPGANQKKNVTIEQPAPAPAPTK